MNKTAASIILLALGALLLWALFQADSHVVINGDAVDGPLGALLALTVGGGGLLLAGAILLLTGVLLAVVFAGLGVLFAGGLASALALLALLFSPLLLPLLVFAAIIWWLTGRARRQRALREAAL